MNLLKQSRVLLDNSIALSENLKEEEGKVLHVSVRKVMSSYSHFAIAELPLRASLYNSQLFLFSEPLMQSSQRAFELRATFQALTA